MRLVWKLARGSRLQYWAQTSSPGPSNGSPPEASQALKSKENNPVHGGWPDEPELRSGVRTVGGSTHR